MNAFETVSRALETRSLPQWRARACVKARGQRLQLGRRRAREGLAHARRGATRTPRDASHRKMVSHVSNR